MRHWRRVPASTVAFALLVTAVVPAPALAATKCMQGSSGGICPDGCNWSRTLCWVGGVPVTGDDAAMDNSKTTQGSSVPGSTNYDLGASVQLHSTTLNSNEGACRCTISGGPIVLEGGGFMTDTNGRRDPAGRGLEGAL
jgi:hypothetical protein